MTTHDVIVAHLTEQVAELVRHQSALRDRDPEAVHRMRVATRRLRSALATFRPVLDRSITDPIRDELKWLGQELGGVRDADVLDEHLVAAIGALPGELVLGPVSARLTREISRRHVGASQQLDGALHSSRYAELLDALDCLITKPPTLRGPDRSARKGLRKPVRHAVRRVDQAIARADRTSGDAERLVALHEVRKAAKRARYAAEAVTPVWGHKAERLANRMESLQTILGEHQDTVDARVALRQFGVDAYLAHENGFTFGLLYEREAIRSGDALDRWPRAARRATKPNVRAFLQ